MKVLILGAGGMAGHVMTLYFQQQGDDVTAFARQPLRFCKTIVGDASEPCFLQSALASSRYDAVINCIGVLNSAVDQAPANGIYINSVLPHMLAQYTENTATQIVHLSTDCVFSGHGNGGYREDSFRDADTLYGRSKALGELNDQKNLTVRTSIIGPDMNADGIGLFHWFMCQQGQVNGFCKVFWSGVTTVALAKGVHAAIEKNITGLIHLVNNEKISKYALLTLFNALRDEPVKILENKDINADKSLVDTRKALGNQVPPYERMVEELREWILQNAQYYPHYEQKGRRI